MRRSAHGDRTLRRVDRGKAHASRVVPAPRLRTSSASPPPSARPPRAPGTGPGPCRCPGGLVVKNGSPARASTSGGMPRPRRAPRCARSRRSRPARSAHLAPPAPRPAARSSDAAQRLRQRARRHAHRGRAVGRARDAPPARSGDSPRRAPSATSCADADGDRPPRRRLAGVGGHLVEDLAAALDLGADQPQRPPAPRGRPSAPPASSSSRATTAMVDSGVASSCAAPAASVPATPASRCAAPARRAAAARLSRASARVTRGARSRR